MKSNVAIHEYGKLKLDIVKSIITTKLDDTLTFGKRLLRSQAYFESLTACVLPQVNTCILVLTCEH